MAKTPRGFETVRDMVLSMALVGAVVFALYAVVAWQRPEVQGSIRPAVDVTGVVDQVQMSGPFPVRQPTDLPDGWSPTSAWFEGPGETAGLGGSVLHVGYTTPSGSYAEVKQTDGDAGFAVKEWAGGATEVGTVQIKGSEWTRLESADTGAKALTVTREGKPDVLVLVTGKADWPELERLAASVR
jgi:hypothetical protein